MCLVFSPSSFEFHNSLKTSRVKFRIDVLSFLQFVSIFRHSSFLSLFVNLDIIIYLNIYVTLQIKYVFIICVKRKVLIFFF